MSCPDPQARRLLAYALGHLDALGTKEVMEHVESCALCSRELDDLADLATAAARVETGPGPRLGRRTSRTVRIVAAAAVLLIVALVLQRALDHSPRWSTYADRSVPPFVGIELRAPAAAPAVDLERAMEGWAARDFPRVERELTDLLRAQPGHAPSHFWRGIARRELGRLQEAEGDLRSAAAQSTGYLREHALWALANLLLQREDAPHAREVLDELEHVDGELAARARELRSRLEADR